MRDKRGRQSTEKKGRKVCLSKYRTITFINTQPKEFFKTKKMMNTSQKMNDHHDIYCPFLDFLLQMKLNKLHTHTGQYL